jgi:hypothetical protein
VLQLNGPLFGGTSDDVSVVTAADPRAVKLRTQHGTLMAVNFIVVFPLGALMARQLRARWLNSLAAKAVLFYMHIAVQVRSLLQSRCDALYGGAMHIEWCMSCALMFNAMQRDQLSTCTLLLLLLLLILVLCACTTCPGMFRF